MSLSVASLQQSLGIGAADLRPKLAARRHGGDASGFCAAGGAVGRREIVNDDPD